MRWVILWIIASVQREQLEEYTQEVERSKKALTAKQDVERSQIEAVHQLTKANQRLEGQVSSLQSQVDSLTSTIVSLQKWVDPYMQLVDHSLVFSNDRNG